MPNKAPEKKPEEPINGVDPHLMRINMSMHEKYQAMVRAMGRDFIRTRDGAMAKVKLFTCADSAMNMTTITVEVKNGTLEKFVEDTLDRKTADALKGIFDHIEEPIQNAIEFLRNHISSRSGEGHDHQEYVDHVSKQIIDLESLLTYKKPFSIPFEQIPQPPEEPE